MPSVLSYTNAFPGIPAPQHGGPAPLTYTGPGDIASSALAWWGLRAYNAAYAIGSNPAVDLVDQSGANPITINILAANGILDIGSINAWVLANSVTTIKVAKIYDQTGNGHHQIQATLSKMPVLVLNGLYDKPIISFTSAFSMEAASISGSNINAPISVSCVVENPGTGVSSFFCDDTFNSYLKLTNGGVNSAVAGSGTFANTSQTNGLYHAIETTWNLTNVKLQVDGTLVSASPSVSNPIFGPNAFLNAAFNNPGTFNMTELGMWTSDVSSNFSSLVSNQTAYWLTLSGLSIVQNYLYPGALQPQQTGPGVLSWTNAFLGIPAPQHLSGQTTVQGFVYPGALQPLQPPPPVSAAPPIGAASM